MSGDVFAVTSGKGGVGKTTTSVNLAIALRQRGHSVVVLDADLGMPNITGFLSIDAETTLHDVLAGDGTPQEAIVEVGEGLGFVFGDRAIEGFANADPERLDGVVSELADRYQYVLVDTGGGLTYEGVYPLELADEALLVTSPIPAAVGDTKKTKQLAACLDVPVVGVIVTRWNGDVDPESIASELDVDLLGAVPTDEAVVESAAKRRPLIVYAPESEATTAYYRLAETLSDPASASLDPLDAARKPSGDGSETPPSESETEADTPAEEPSETGSTEATEKPAADGRATEAESTTEGESTAENGSPSEGKSTADESTDASEPTSGARADSADKDAGNATQSEAKSEGTDEESTAESGSESESNGESGFFDRIFGWLR